MAGDFGVEPFPGFQLVRWSSWRVSACRAARAAPGDGGEALPVARAVPPPAHPAVTLAVLSATSGKIRLGIGAKDGRDRHPAEKHHQRKCDRAAHNQATV